MKVYGAKWGKTLKWVSGLMSMLGSVSAAAVPSPPEAVPMWTPLALPACVGGCLPFLIQNHAITEDAVLIRRLFWSTRLARAGLKSAEAVPDAMTGSSRTCGNGGIFSFTGWFWSGSPGGDRAFVTDPQRTVVLRFEKRTVILSPEFPADFASGLRRDAPAAVAHAAAAGLAGEGPAGG